MKNALAACFAGLAYAAVTGANPAGYLYASLLFIALGFLYTFATQYLSDFCNCPTRPEMNYAYLLFRAVVIFLGLLGTMALLSWVGGWELLYSIFRWRETDPLGPAFASQAFGVAFPVVTILWGIAVLVVSRKRNNKILR